MSSHEIQNASANVARLNVAGLEVVVAPTDAELRGPISELFRLFDDVLQRVPAGRRAIVGLAGVPGSGKSTLAALLAFFGTRVEPPLPAAAVSIDGWHWPNDRLDAMPATGPRGEPVTMRQRKGSAGSYDVEGLARAIDALRDAHMPMRLPAYDRRRHEAAPESLIVPPGVRLIVFEGNYVLSHESPWRGVAERLDLALYLELDAARAREAIITRHVAGGLSRREATAKYESNDSLNADLVRASRANADVIVYADVDHRLERVEPLTDRGRLRRDLLRRLPSVGQRDALG